MYVAFIATDTYNQGNSVKILNFKHLVFYKVNCQYLV